MRVGDQWGIDYMNTMGAKPKTARVDVFLNRIGVRVETQPGFVLRGNIMPSLIPERILMADED